MLSGGRPFDKWMKHGMRHNDQITQLGRRLAGFCRVLLWGEMGVGKSTLALELSRWLSRYRGGGQILALDPGSPPFGVPGALNRGWWHDDVFVCAGHQALCTLNAARFRLPLVLTARKLLVDALGGGEDTPLVIDPPGVVRGVGGAELLVALATALEVDAVVVLSREGTAHPLTQELDWLPVQVLRVSAAPEARRPSRTARGDYRTTLWDRYLADSAQETFLLDNLPVLGTPPPLYLPEAWIGRQAALLDAEGLTLKMGEVVRLTGPRLTLRLPTGSSAAPAGLLIRDAGRNARGRLETIPSVHSMAPANSAPAEMIPPVIAAESGNAPVHCRVGPAWATLVGGVFGDPLVHVRLRNQKQSFFFDLGDPARLAARTAHQVRAVCLSHAHMDHIGGFVWFLRARIGPFGPCRIFGPAETITRIENFLGAITWDRIDANAPVFDVCEFDGTALKRARLQPGSGRIDLSMLPVEDGILLSENNLIIKAVVCDHKIPSVAYALIFRMEISVRKERLAACGLAPGPWLGRLKQCIAAETPQVEIDLPDGTRRSAGELARDLTLICPGKKLVYAADMADSPPNREKLIDLARSAHTLFCETAFTVAHADKAGATQHLTTLAAVDIARKAGVERLVPFHFSKRYEDDPAKVYEEILAAAGPVKIVGRFDPVLPSRLPR